MAKRRATAAGTASSGSNVYVSFDGLAELFRGSAVQLPMAVPPTAAPIMTVEPKKQVNDVTKWPKMVLATFCDQFDIPDSLQEKLVKLGVQGPHALSWIKDDDFRGEGALLLGELGTLRDAERRWMNYCTWDT
jgi:hypothetical protein